MLESAGFYHVSKRYVMQDTPNVIIKSDGDNNTVIKINQSESLSDISAQNTPLQNYPTQVKFTDFLNKKVGYFNTSGLNLLHVNGNYYIYFRSYLTQTGNSLLF